MQAVRRLSRIDTRSVEQVVSLDDDDDVFNYPWIYAVQVGEWGMTQKEGAKLREYFQRGGFFMADDFHGNEEWAEFEKRIRFALPDRPILEMPDDDPYFHTVFDITDRPQTRRLRSIWAKAARTATTAAAARTGVAFTTTRAASWWGFLTTPIWATRGSMPIIRCIRNT